MKIFLSKRLSKRLCRCIEFFALAFKSRLVRAIDRWRRIKKKFPHDDTDRIQPPAHLVQHLRILIVLILDAPELVAKGLCLLDSRNAREKDKPDQGSQCEEKYGPGPSLHLFPVSRTLPGNSGQSPRFAGWPDRPADGHTQNEVSVSLRAFLFLIPLAGLLIGCGSKATETAPSKAAASDTPVVAVTKAERRDIGDDFDIVAEFRPYQEADLYAKISGYLSKLNVDIGDTVKEGQLLAALEIPELRQELETAAATEKRSQLETGRAQGDVDRAASLLKIREITYERISSIVKQRPNLVARQEFDDAAARYEESKGQLAAAQANLAAAQQQIQVSQSARARLDAMLQYTRITAPFSGVVTTRYVFPGALIQAGTSSATQAKPVVRIAQISKLRLSAPVPESLISKLKVGQPVEIKVDALQRVFQGKVSRTSDSVANLTRTMDTEIDVNNSNLVLKPGMVAHVSLPVERRTNTITVPLQAIVERDGKPVVFVVTPAGEIAQREVKRGIETAEQVEIASGLKEGELAVIAGQSQLRAGQKAQAKLIEVAR